MNFPDVLVLGATGRIGAVLRQCWPIERARWQTRRPMSGPGWVQFDPLKDTQALIRAAQGCGTILCLAGVTNTRAAAGADLRDNLALARAAIRAGAETGARALLASSAAVYGAPSGLLEENCALAPVSEYGRAKAKMEAEGAELGARLGVGVTSLRIGNIAGLDAILGGWRPGFVLDRFTDGRTPRRSYIGPQTLARVLFNICEAPSLPAALNVATPGVVEMGALLDAAGLGWTSRPAPADAIAEVRLSVTELSKVTHFTAEDSRQETMVAEWRLLRSG